MEFETYTDLWIDDRPVKLNYWQGSWGSVVPEEHQNRFQKIADELGYDEIQVLGPTMTSTFHCETYDDMVKMKSRLLQVIAVADYKTKI